MRKPELSWPSYKNTEKCCIVRVGQDMDIELAETDCKGRYFWKSPEGHPAEMTFSKAGEHLVIIDHTEVSGELKGQGVGIRMLERAVTDARASGKKIVPLCPFAAAQFRKRPEWADVLNK